MESHGIKNRIKAMLGGHHKAPTLNHDELRPDHRANQEKKILGCLSELKQKVLDLSADNPLIAYHHDDFSNVRMVNSPINVIYQTLLSHPCLEIRSLPEPEQHSRSLGLDLKVASTESYPDGFGEQFAEKVGVNTSFDLESSKYSTELLQDNLVLQTLLFPHQLESKLKHLTQLSLTGIEEKGSQTLYLALGFLDWSPWRDERNQTLSSPLLLIPVEIIKQRFDFETNTHVYAVRIKDGDVLNNLALFEYFEQQFGLRLPEFSKHLDPEHYFQNIAQMLTSKGMDVSEKTGFSVRRYCTLMDIDVSPLAQFLDLEPRRWSGEDSNLLEINQLNRIAFSVGQEEGGQTGNSKKKKSSEKAESIDLRDVCLLTPMDPFQYKAINQVLAGKNVLLDGAPGTGKTQTVFNVIANLMGQGRRVLFLSNKKESIKELSSLLAEQQLDVFALTLVAGNLSQAEILRQFKEENLEPISYIGDEEVSLALEHYEGSLKHLSDYSHLLQETWLNTGFTLSDIFHRAVRYRLVLGIDTDKVIPSFPLGEEFTPAKFRLYQELVQRFAQTYKKLVPQLTHEGIQSHAWYGVKNHQLLNSDFPKVLQVLKQWQNSLQELHQLVHKVRSRLPADAPALDSFTGIQLFIQELEALPGCQGKEEFSALSQLQGERLALFESYVQESIRLRQRYEQLTPYFTGSFLSHLGNVKVMSQVRGHLSRLHIAGKTELQQLQRVQEYIRTIRERLDNIRRVIHFVTERLEKEFSEVIHISRSGLLMFSDLLRLVSELKPSLWKKRSSFFKQIDSLLILERLSDEVLKLKSQRKRLAKRFKLEELPDLEELKDIQRQLSNCGWIQRANVNWHRAKAKLLSFSTLSSDSLEYLVGELDELILYVEAQKAFDQCEEYHSALGSLFHGIETPVADYISLHEWYQQVRKCFGDGFGAKAVLADLLFTMAETTALELQDLSHEGIQDNIYRVLDDLQALEQWVPAASQLVSHDSRLLGMDCPLYHIDQWIDGIIKPCQRWVQKKNLVAQDIFDLESQLLALQKDVLAWNKKKYFDRIFSRVLPEQQNVLKRLKIEIGVDIGTLPAFDAAKQTLVFAQKLNQDIKTEGLKALIYQCPKAQTFSLLKTIAEYLKLGLNRHFENAQQFESLAVVDLDAWQSRCENHLTYLMDRNDHAILNFKQLAVWVHYLQARQRLCDRGFRSLAMAVESCQLAVEKVDEGYYLGIYESLAQDVLVAHPMLGQDFDCGSNHRLTRVFDAQNHLRHLQTQKIQHQAFSHQGAEALQGIRKLHDYIEGCDDDFQLSQLFEGTADFIQSIKPCVLSSPAVLAEHMTTDQMHFDVVVFDDASQLTFAESLSGIARSDQMVVIGDRQQVVLENSKVVKSSLINAVQPHCESVTLRSCFQATHHRLFEFINFYFYENTLSILPSPNFNDKEQGLFDRPVLSGGCDKGVNRKEAHEVLKTLRHLLVEQPHISIGVVVLDEAQRDYLLYELDILSYQDAEFKQSLVLNERSPHPLWVKTLHQTQGVMRDVILLSIGYGPREMGQDCSVEDFGCLSSPFGETYLNIALTRGRCSTYVFHSVEASLIPLAPDTPAGVMALKDFLCYLESGELQKSNDVLLPSTTDDLQEDEGLINEENEHHNIGSDLELSLQSAFIKLGFESDTHLSVSGQAINVAIKDPYQPDQYLLAILLDVPFHYPPQHSCGMLDVPLSHRLEKLGWKVHHVWSIEWYLNPKQVLEELLGRLNECVSISRLGDGDYFSRSYQSLNEQNWLPCQTVMSKWENSDCDNESSYEMEDIQKKTHAVLSKAEFRCLNNVVVKSAVKSALNNEFDQYSVSDDLASIDSSDICLPVGVYHPTQNKELIMVIDIEEHGTAKDHEQRRIWAETCGVSYIYLKKKQWQRELEECLEQVLQDLTALAYAPN